jgi:hypothetical protein
MSGLPLIVVEGSIDRDFIYGLGVGELAEVIPLGGADRFPKWPELVGRHSRLLETAPSIVLIVDSDDKRAQRLVDLRAGIASLTGLDGAGNSVSVQRNELMKHTPEKRGTISGTVTVGAMIVPLNREGAIEDLLIEAHSNDPAALVVDSRWSSLKITETPGQHSKRNWVATAARTTGKFELNYDRMYGFDLWNSANQQVWPPSSEVGQLIEFIETVCCIALPKSFPFSKPPDSRKPGR